VVGSVICCFEACGINTLVEEFLDEFCDADSLALSEGPELGVERLRHDYMAVSRLRHLGFFPSYSFLWGLFIWEAAASLSCGSSLLARFRWPLAPRDALARRPGSRASGH